MELSTLSEKELKALKSRGRVYTCIRCDKYQDNLVNAQWHFRKEHVPLDQVPFYCVLCSYRAPTKAKLDWHIHKYIPHVEAAEIAGMDDPYFWTRENLTAYVCRTSERREDNPDLLRESEEDSLRIWAQRPKRVRKDKQHEQSVVDLAGSEVSESQKQEEMIPAVTPAPEAVVKDTVQVAEEYIPAGPIYIPTPQEELLLRKVEDQKAADDLVQAMLHEDPPVNSPKTPSCPPPSLTKDAASTSKRGDLPAGDRSTEGQLRMLNKQFYHFASDNQSALKEIRHSIEELGDTSDSMRSTLERLLESQEELKSIMRGVASLLTQLVAKTPSPAPSLGKENKRPIEVHPEEPPVKRRDDRHEERHYRYYHYRH